jgi:putative ABC transport system permease protein
VLFGLAPALRGASAAAARTGTRVTHSRRSRRVAQGLVVAQVALALMLASAAGLMLRSFIRLGQVDPGFAVADRLVASILLPPRYASDGGILAFVDALTARIEAIPGVRGVTYGSRLPFTGTGERLGSLVVEGRPGERYDGALGTRLVAPTWFEVLDVPLLRGRPFTDADRPDGERVVVINERLARLVFRDDDPVGHRIGWTETAGEPDSWQRIVGVVGNEHQTGLRIPPEPEAFTSFRQLPSRRLRLIVHADADLTALAPALRAALAEVDAELPLADLQPLEARYATLFGGDRLLLALIGAFAALALVLAAVGVYGLMAELVAARTREVGIRLVLGAAAPAIARSILGQGLVLAAIGVMVGLAGAAAGARLLSAVLFGVAPTDAPTFATVTVLLIAAALLACAVPALRAARVEPGAALRQD